MDVFAHTLWTNAVFHLKYKQERRLRYIAATFGALPDLVGFLPLTVFMFLQGIDFDPNTFYTSSHWTYQYASQAYNYTHSLVIFAAATLLFMLLRKGKLYWPMLAWGLHILLDIPTHPDFFHTPFLYPLSDYQYAGGVSWAHPVFMLVNYGLLAIIYSIIFWYRSSRLKTLREKYARV